MKLKECPACNHWTYRCYPGNYDSEGNKLSPDYSTCSHCGFSYEEDIRTSESKEAKEWREQGVPNEKEK